MRRKPQKRAKDSKRILRAINMKRSTMIFLKSFESRNIELLTKKQENKIGTKCNKLSNLLVIAAVAF